MTVFSDKSDVQGMKIETNSMDPLRNSSGRLYSSLNSLRAWKVNDSINI